MASGKLGSVNLVADTDTLVYTVPAGKVSTVNIRVCNRNASGIAISVAVGSGGSPATTDYIDYETVVPAKGMLEDTAVVCSAGEKIWVRSNTKDVSVRVHGFEENV